MPESFEEFQKKKYNDGDKWKQLKSDYCIVNQYINHINVTMKSNKIIELDKLSFDTKRNQFSSKFKRTGNIGVMELDGDIYFAHGSASTKLDSAFQKFKGNKEKLIINPKERKFETLYVGTHDRKTDSEYKLFERAATIVKDGKKHKLNMLSEISSCESCLGVMEQFVEKISKY